MAGYLAAGAVKHTPADVLVDIQAPELCDNLMVGPIDVAMPCHE
jgi:hypothetical protein